MHEMLGTSWQTGQAGKWAKSAQVRVSVTVIWSQQNNVCVYSESTVIGDKLTRLV